MIVDKWRPTSRNPIEVIVRCVALRLSLFLKIVDGDAPYSNYSMSFEN